MEITVPDHAAQLTQTLLSAPQLGNTSIGSQAEQDEASSSSLGSLTGPGDDQVDTVKEKL